MMKTGICCLTIALCIVLSSEVALVCAEEDSKPYPDPGRYEETIQGFENSDKEQAPPRDAIVCIGSSSMRGWHQDMDEDLKPLTVIPRGFGGSNMNDALHYADRIVLPYKPRAVVLYEGDNDVAGGITPEKIKDTFNEFVGKIHAELPETRIYFLSIKPSISRWRIWPQMAEANRLIEQECAERDLLTYIDVATGMLDEEGKPLKNIFKADNLHMNREGYVIWRDAVRPVLIEKELQFESNSGE